MSCQYLWRDHLHLLLNALPRFLSIPWLHPDQHLPRQVFLYLVTGISPLQLRFLQTWQLTRPM